MHESAPAKINLTLNLTGRRHDGYHLLESLVIFTPHSADRIELTDNPHPLYIQGEFASELSPRPDNLVLRAAHLLAQSLGKRDIPNLLLTKNLPIASGIGGGSSDAAATLRLLARFWDCTDTERLEKLAENLGADVKMCLNPQPCFVTSIGETVTPIASLPECHLLLANPRRPLATPAVFRQYRDSGQNFSPSNPFSGSSECDFFDWLARGGNDLTHAACALEPTITDLLDRLRQSENARLVRMSGSGATCFALFDNITARDAAAIKLATSSQKLWISPLPNLPDSVM